MSQSSLITIKGDQFIKAYNSLQTLLIELLSTDIDRVSLIRLFLHQGELPAALYIAQFIRESELIQIFSELVELASHAHRHIEAVRNIIKLLPRQWVIDNIEAVVEPILAQGSEDEFRRFLEIYKELDDSLVQRLAERAIVHNDIEIQEAGHDFRN